MARPRWRVCPCNRRYEISDLGGVRNKKTRRAIAQHDNGRGYLRVRMYHAKKGNGHWYAVHLLVLVTFEYPRPGPEFEGSHQDGNCTNNKLKNLFWKTKQQNTADRVKHMAQRKGVQHE